MVYFNKCPLCNSKEIIAHLRCRDHFFSNEEFEIFRCVLCGFIFTQDHPDEISAGRYYESDEYVSHNDTSAGFSNMLYKLSRKIMLVKKRKLILKLTGIKTGKLLDIGSGSGHFLHEMKNAGWDITGIEINEKVRTISEKKFNLTVISPANMHSVETGSFDCITLWHVLEHFHDPFSYAREIYRLLKPGGICIAAMPNSDSFDAHYYLSSWAAYDVPRHLWHFNPDTFEKFCHKAGLHLMRMASLPLDVFYISILSEKYRGNKFYFFTGMIKGAWFSIRSLFSKNKASSLIYILKKQS